MMSESQNTTNQPYHNNPFPFDLTSVGPDQISGKVCPQSSPPTIYVDGDNRIQPPPKTDSGQPKPKCLVPGQLFF